MLVTNPALGFREGRPLKIALLNVVGIWGRFSRQGRRKINKLSLLEPVTGNFNSLMPRENSLFFLSPDGPSWRGKYCELCSMPCGAMPEQEPKPQDFPVIFPVSREMQRESGSLETASTVSNKLSNGHAWFWRWRCF